MKFLLKERLRKFFVIAGLVCIICLIGSAIFGDPSNSFEVYRRLFMVFGAIFLIVENFFFVKAILFALWLNRDRGISIPKVITRITQFGLYKGYSEIYSELFSQGEY